MKPKQSLSLIQTDVQVTYLKIRASSCVGVPVTLSGGKSMLELMLSHSGVLKSVQGFFIHVNAFFIAHNVYFWLCSEVGELSSPIKKTCSVKHVSYMLLLISFSSCIFTHAHSVLNANSCIGYSCLSGSLVSLPITASGGKGNGRLFDAIFMPLECCLDGVGAS